MSSYGGVRKVEDTDNFKDGFYTEQDGKVIKWLSAEE